ncbi:MAG: ABC transporter permease, partial [Candidatus Bathyarchaeia archaeon]
MWHGVRHQLREIFRYKLAAAGIGILIILIGISIYTIIAIPYDVATYLWRGGEGIWLDCPRNALPSWVNIFLSKRLPETIVLDTQKEQRGVTKVIVPISEDMSKIRIEFSFDYNYDEFPSEINLFYTATYDKRSPLITVYWAKPGSQQIKIKDIVLRQSGAYYISIDEMLANNLQTYISQKIGGTPE